jgi:hypothetical protein
MVAIKRYRRRAAGVVSVLAMMLLIMLAALSVALFNSSSMGLAQSSNLQAMADTRLAMEGGVSFLAYQIERSGASGSLRGQALLDSLATRLGATMNGTKNLQRQVVGYDSHTITIPSICPEAGKSFSGQIILTAADRLRLTVTGLFTSGQGASARSLQRRASLDFRPNWDQALAFGLCSKGPVEMGMNTDLSGVSRPSDGSIYSAARGLAVDCGSGHISGDVSVSDPFATTSLLRTTVDGQVRYGVPPVPMPTIDRTPYMNVTFTDINSTNKGSYTSGTLKNVRIKANTNPTFGSVAIQGVLYIEAPNQIYFNNNVSFAGVMVADDPPVGSPDSANYIYFKNNMTFNGVDTLPDTPDFAAVKNLTGASILCPGFTMEFKNNMTSVAGIIALKALTAKNNLSSTVLGSMLIYGDAGLDFKNNTDLNIALSGSAPPPGFQGYGKPPLEAVPGSYLEE